MGHWVLLKLQIAFWGTTYRSGFRIVPRGIVGLWLRIRPWTAKWSLRGKLRHGCTTGRISRNSSYCAQFAPENVHLPCFPSSIRLFHARKILGNTYDTQVLPLIGLWGPIWPLLKTATLRSTVLQFVPRGKVYPWWQTLFLELELASGGKNCLWG